MVNKTFEANYFIKQREKNCFNGRLNILALAAKVTYLIYVIAYINTYTHVQN